MLQISRLVKGLHEPYQALQNDSLSNGTINFSLSQASTIMAEAITTIQTRTNKIYLNHTRWKWHHNTFTSSLHLVPFCQN